MDIRKFVLMMGVGMVLTGCGDRRSRSEGYRMAKEERKAAWERQWAAEVPTELLPYWEVLDTIGDEFRRDGYGCLHEYCMYDITGDGIPELWLTSGFCEMNKMLYVYALKDSRPVKIFEAFGGHCGYYKGKNKVIREIFQGSSGELSSCEYDGMKIKENWIPYNEMNDEREKHADEPEEEEAFQALLAECVETEVLEFREVNMR